MEHFGDLYDIMAVCFVILKNRIIVMSIHTFSDPLGRNKYLAGPLG